MTQIKSKKAKDYIMNIVEPIATPDGELVFYVEMTPLQVVDAIIIAESEAEERHAKELQELKEKAVTAFKYACIGLDRATCGCAIGGMCNDGCHFIAEFIAKLNEL